MTIKSILKIAGLFLGKNDIISALDLENLSSASQSVQDEIDFLIKCLNLSYQEVASDYVPLLYREKVTLTDWKLNFSSLTKTLVDVISTLSSFVCKYDGKLSYLTFKPFESLREITSTSVLVRELKFNFQSVNVTFSL